MRRGVLPTIRPLNVNPLHGSEKPRQGRKKLRFQKSRVKTMLVIFFDCQGVIHKEFVPESETINAVYYKGVMERLLKRIRRVRPDMCESGDRFLFARQRPVPQRDNHQAVFGPTKSDWARPPSVFARFSNFWLLFVPKSEIPLEGASIWLDFGHPESRHKYINLLKPNDIYIYIYVVPQR